MRTLIALSSLLLVVACSDKSEPSDDTGRPFRDVPRNAGRT